MRFVNVIDLFARGLVLYLFNVLIRYLLAELIPAPLSILLHVCCMFFIGRAVSSEFYNKHKDAQPILVSILIIVPKLVFDLMAVHAFGMLTTIIAWTGIMWQGHVARRRDLNQD